MYFKGMNEAPRLLGFGQPFPLGAHLTRQGVNFSLVSPEAKEVTLCLFPSDDKQALCLFSLDPERNRSGGIWHAEVSIPSPYSFYAYQINGGGYLLDPYAQCVRSSPYWMKAGAYAPLGVVPVEEAFDWEGDLPPSLPKEKLLIYEMHVRGLTQHFSSRVSAPGTFLGVIEKIPYLKDLGINAVELLPVLEFNEAEYDCCAVSSRLPLCNYWGYSPVSFFALMNRFCQGESPHKGRQEFKKMVKELHRAGIEVILDLVFNHTAEGGLLGPTLSFKGLSQGSYYMMTPEGRYLDFTGCGNTVNCNHPTTVELILASLRYWVGEMHVDGFRFDLASIFTRGRNGRPLDPAPLVQAIAYDARLSGCKLIAEPWDAVGLYQVGSFYRVAKGQRFSEWNGQYRDSVRQFLKGTDRSAGIFATRVCGSQDLYGGLGSPLNSINFITSHDGFTLRDLVSYQRKHNEGNGENNRDGLNDNESWNCGAEGLVKDPKILQLREQQMRNFHLALMLSRGIPMLHMGDEYGHTKSGNNNSWCQDNEVNWFLWDELEKNSSFFRFYRLLIHFRKSQTLLQRASFVEGEEIAWHGWQPFHPDWSAGSRLVAFQLLDPQGEDLFALFHPGMESRELTLPALKGKYRWHWVVNTGNPSPEDIYEEGQWPLVTTEKIPVLGYSSLLFKACEESRDPSH